MSGSQRPGDEDLIRCDWGNLPPDYMAYHDDEWGYPVDDDDLLFEKLCRGCPRCC